MKLTAIQLRNIIREEVKKATLGKKNLSEGMTRITEDEIAAWKSGNLGYVSGDAMPEPGHDDQEFLHGSEEGHPYDAEGDMVKSRLGSMAKMSNEISELLHDEDQLPGWVQDLVATSHNDLQHVYDYLTGEASEMAAQQTMPVGEARSNKSKNLNESHAQVTQDEMRAFVERSNLPVLATPMGKGIVKDTDPRSVGSARTFVLQNADVIFLCCARLNWMLHFGAPPRFNKNFKII
jgi:hypothetical protein